VGVGGLHEVEDVMALKKERKGKIRRK